MIKTVRNAYASWTTNQSQARAARELQSLTDRELNDLGIGRGQIWQAVRNGAKDKPGAFL